MIQFKDTSKVYQKSRAAVHALDGVDLSVRKGEFLVIRGSSGSGKTTLLLSAGGMLRPTGGDVVVNEQSIYQLPAKDRARFRAKHIGFVFQMFHLVPYLSALDNVCLAHGGGQLKREKAAALLERFGVADRANHLPSELSAGEKQRTAIARALSGEPDIILADEPTGNLDPDNANAVFGYLSEYHKNGGTVLVVTHGDSADRFADRIVYMENGKLKN